MLAHFNSTRFTFKKSQNEGLLFVSLSGASRHRLRVTEVNCNVTPTVRVTSDLSGSGVFSLRSRRTGGTFQGLQTVVRCVVRLYSMTRSPLKPAMHFSVSFQQTYKHFTSFTHYCYYSAFNEAERIPAFVSWPGVWVVQALWHELRQQLVES